MHGNTETIRCSGGVRAALQSNGSIQEVGLPYVVQELARPREPHQMDRLDVDQWKDTVASIVYRQTVGLTVAVVLVYFMGQMNNACNNVAYVINLY